MSRERQREEVNYARLHPEEFDARLAEAPVAYVPIGSLEWHSHHMPYGVDTDKAVSMCEMAASRHGGIVLPGNPWGAMHGSWRGATHPGLRPETIHAMALDILRGLAEVGFRVAMVVSGHWTSRQTIPYRAALRQVTAETGLLGHVTFDGSDHLDGYPAEHGLGMDHAGALESSVYGALYPNQMRPERLVGVDLSDLPGEECHLTISGIQGRSPLTGIDYERGLRHAETMADLLGETARRLLARSDAEPGEPGGAGA
jgi:creatinine amidohydrolase